MFRERLTLDFRYIPCDITRPYHIDGAVTVKTPGREDDMQLRTTALMTLAVLAVSAPAAVQAQQATRTVVAATKLSSVTDKPLLFRALSVTIPAAARDSISPADGVLYQVSGSTEVAIGSEAKTLHPGEGIFIGSGKTASLQAGSDEPSVSIHFLLVPVADADKPVETAPAVAKEIYRTPAPIPGLKPGTYDLNLTRITFPAGMPSNAPHHRSGAALYYVLSGAGANTIAGKVETRTPGNFIYEPSTLVHQWGNPGGAPLTFLTFNINQEGVPAVIAEAPARRQ
jgi:quercetin dioxygenase-like cupin family protein